MRDVVLRSMISQDHKRRKLVLKETAEENGVLSNVEKELCYTVKTVLPHNFSGIFPKPKKDLSIRRVHNTKTGEGKFEYKFTGDIFIINKDNLLMIEFAYRFCIDSSKISLDITS